MLYRVPTKQTLFTGCALGTKTAPADFLEKQMKTTLTNVKKFYGHHHDLFDLSDVYVSQLTIDKCLS